MTTKISEEWKTLIARHQEQARRAGAGGGSARQARQRRLGRMLARERIEALVDPGSFVDLRHHVTHQHADMDPRLAASRPPGDGVICGLGKIDGVTVGVCAHDVTVLRGAVGSAGADKIARLLRVAIDRALPIITLADSDGARVPEGVHAIAGWSEVMGLTVKHRKLAPHLTIATGLCVGAVAYNAMLADFVAMVDHQSFMFITGPSVTQTVTGESVEIDDLGGPALHFKQTGACHAVFDDEHGALAWARALLAYTAHKHTPSTDDPTRSCDKLYKIIPTAPRRAYDVRKVLREVFDADSVLELGGGYGASLLTALARIDGRSVAILASQPMARSGCLDIDSSRKGAKFLEYANTHGLPVITLVDTSGYLPGLQQEQGGILVEGARLIRAYAELEVPTISVTLRKCYGGASVLAGASRLRFALPTAETSPMGAEAAARVALGPPREDGSDEARRAEFIASWRQTHGDAWLAAERGFFDDVILPAELRAHLWRVLETTCPEEATR